MKVKIVKCTNHRAWYLSRIGEEFDVDNKWHDDRFYRHISKGGWELVIIKSDCIEVDDEKSLHELLKPKLPKETQQMKNKLQVSLKIQPDGKTVIAECTHIADELRGKGTLAEKGGYSIESCDYLSMSSIHNRLYVRGEDRHLDYKIDCKIFPTPEQAQHFVKIMNELIDAINNPKVDWSKVEVGADVKVKVVKVDCGWTFNCKFKEYVKETNQIIVFNDNKVEAYDASEVKLC